MGEKGFLLIKNEKDMIELIIRIELSDCSEAISFLFYQVNEEIRQVVFSIVTVTKDYVRG